MGCSHEEGTDECHRNEKNDCLSMKNSRDRAYRKDNMKSSSLGVGRTGDIGQASELIVRTDLLLRRLEVTVPENRSSPDDVHFKSSLGWISVQVKTVEINHKTGHWRLRSRNPITSDVIAWVNVKDRSIRYQANTKEVPTELL